MSGIGTPAIGNLTVSSSGSDGAILDGVSASIKATVFDLASANPLTVAVVDSTGAQITAFGGSGTQYTEGDVDASITGTATMMEVAGNTLQPIQGTVADGLLVNLGTNNDVIATGNVASGSVDSGNPVKVGGVYNATLPTIVNGQRGDLQISSRGSLNVSLHNWSTGEAVPYLTDNADDVSVDSSQNHLVVISRDTVFDGTAWDRMRGDSTNGLLVNLGTNNDVDTELPAAAALGDTDANPTTPLIGAAAMGFNSTTWERLRCDIGDGAVSTGLQNVVPMMYNGASYDRIRGATADGLLVNLGTNNDVTITSGTITTVTTLTGTTTLTPGTAAANLGKAEDAIHASGDTGVMALGVGNVAQTVLAADGDYIPLATDTAGNILVVGNVAAGTTDSGNPVKVGGKYNSTFPTFTDGQRGDLQLGSRGALRVELVSPGAAVGSYFVADNADGVAVSATAKTMVVASRNTVFNGTSWDRVRGNTTNGLQVYSGTAAADLGKAEDGAHTSGDTGVFALSVRNDTPNAVLAAAGDYQQVSSDMVGGVRTALYETDFAVLGTSHVKKYYANTGAVTDGIVWSPAAGKRWYVTDILFTTSAAATVTFEDDLTAGDSVVLAGDFAANSGFAHHFATPLFSGEDAMDFLVTTSAGNIKVTVCGYEI